MSYNKTLQNMIKNSGLTLKEVAERCKAEGVSIDPSYISKLSGGNQSPASEEINIALAKACGQDPEDLLFESYLEKAPDSIKTFITQVSKFVRELTSVLARKELPIQAAKLADDKVNSFSDLTIMKLIINENLFDMLNKYKKTEVIRDTDDQDIKIIMNPMFGLTMPDNSMEPTIPAGARLQLSEPEYVENGDIVAAYISEDVYAIRKYVLVDKKIFLFADNTSIEPLTFNKKSLKLIGKVKSFTKEL